MNPRKYGAEPFSAAVIHGGPGGAGEVAPIAEKLSERRGVLEPFQTAGGLVSQARELNALLENSGTPPFTVIGYSWGAWVGFVWAARFPEKVSRLILVSSGPFEASYAEDILPTRLNRMEPGERSEARRLLDNLENGNALERKRRFSRLGKLFIRADAFDPLPDEGTVIDYRCDIFLSAWEEGEALRRSGELLEMGTRIRCPVIAVHGDYDPHPAEGIQKPLATVLKDFRFILLKNCGHKPWIERQARRDFFRILEGELI